MVEQKAAPLDFGILLGLAYQTFTERLRETLAAQDFDDLGAAYGYVFRALADARPSQRELARRLQITDQGMAKIVAEMIERRYVERQVDRDDARVFRLRLAPRGQAALRSARRFHAAFEKQLAKEIGAASVRTLRKLLASTVARGGDSDIAHARLRPM